MIIYDKTPLKQQPKILQICKNTALLTKKETKKHFSLGKIILLSEEIVFFLRNIFVCGS